MDKSGSWEPGAPEKRVWTQSAWHGAPADHGSKNREGWNSGTGYGGDGVFAGEWTVSTMAVHELRRRINRFLAISASIGLAFVAGLVALGVVVFQHGGALAVLLMVLAVPVVLLGLTTAVALWIGRRAWRRGAWMEAVPLAVGMPWLSRVVWAVRAALFGKAFWRLRQRARRPRHQARTGDLSGTTR